MKIKKFNESKDNKAKYPEKVLSFHDINSDNQRLKNIYNSYITELNRIKSKLEEYKNLDKIVVYKKDFNFKNAANHIGSYRISYGQILPDMVSINTDTHTPRIVITDTRIGYPINFDEIDRIETIDNIAKNDSTEFLRLYDYYCGEGRLRDTYRKIFEKPEYKHILNSAKYNL